MTSQECLMLRVLMGLLYLYILWLTTASAVDNIDNRFRQWMLLAFTYLLIILEMFQLLIILENVYL